MTDLIDTTEMYLRTILELEEEGITPMRARTGCSVLSLTATWRSPMLAVRKRSR